MLTCVFWVLIIGLRPIPLAVACVLSGLFWGRTYVAFQRKGYLFFPPTESYQRDKLGNFTKGVFALMAFFGFLLVGIAITITLHNFSLLLFGHETIGVVIRQQEEWKQVEVKAKTRTRSAVHENRLFYYAIVEIEVGEEPYEIMAQSANTTPIYPTGSEIDVLYFSKNPGTGKIKREAKSPWGAFFLVIFGFVLIGAACTVMFVSGAWRVPEGIKAIVKKKFMKRFPDTRGAERLAATGEASKFAVGAIIKDHEEEKYLLIHTVKHLENQTAPASDSGEWNFPKGGLISPKEPRRSALLRVLREKTGSEYYTILDEFEEKLMQEFTQDENPPSTTQETTLYLVKYTGDGTDLSPQDEEVEQVGFFLPEEVLERISIEELQAFFKKHVFK